MSQTHGDVFLTWSQSARASVTSPLAVDITVDNQTKASTPRSTRLRFRGNSHFMPAFAEVGCVAEFSQRTTRLVLRPIGGASVTTMCPTFTVQLVDDATGRTLCHMSGSLSFASFDRASGLLGNTCTPGSGSLNIFIVGPHGSGKSSFLNSTATMLSNNREAVVTNACAVGGSTKHCTTAISPFQLDGLQGVRLWDTYGMAEDTYKGKEFNALLGGVLPEVPALCVP